MRESRFDVRWLAIAIFCTVATLILTHVPQEIIPSVLREGSFDKLEHGVTYGVVMALFLIALRTPPTVFWILRLFGVVAVVAAFDELTQGLVNRTPSITDFAADLLGMLVAVSFCTLWKCQFRRQSP